MVRLDLDAPWQTSLVYLYTVASPGSKSSRMTSLLLTCENRAKPASRPVSQPSSKPQLAMPYLTTFGQSTHYRRPGPKWPASNGGRSFGDHRRISFPLNLDKRTNARRDWCIFSTSSFFPSSWPNWKTGGSCRQAPRPRYLGMDGTWAFVLVLAHAAAANEY